MAACWYWYGSRTFDTRSVLLPPGVVGRLPHPAFAWGRVAYRRPLTPKELERADLIPLLGALGLMRLAVYRRHEGPLDKEHLARELDRAGWLVISTTVPDAGRGASAVWDVGAVEPLAARSRSIAALPELVLDFQARHEAAAVVGVPPGGWESGEISQAQAGQAARPSGQRRAHLQVAHYGGRRE